MTSRCAHDEAEVAEITYILRKMNDGTGIQRQDRTLRLYHHTLKVVRSKKSLFFPDCFFSVCKSSNLRRESNKVFARKKNRSE